MPTISRGGATRRIQQQQSTFFEQERKHPQQYNEIKITKRYSIFTHLGFGTKSTLDNQPLFRDKRSAATTAERENGTC
jgi:hypothetical protein